LGCIEDSGNHKRITPLLRFYTSKSEEELKSLDEYVENMGENQKAIYYLATDSLKSAKTAPFLEKLVQKDIEVFSVINTIISCNLYIYEMTSKVEPPATNAF
jgi:heat shock protein beta